MDLGTVAYMQSCDLGYSMQTHLFNMVSLAYRFGAPRPR